MKTALLLAATLIAATAIMAGDADAKSKRHKRHVDAGSYETCCTSVPYRISRGHALETHDSIRAHAADPTRQYNLPDWARAAFEPRGGRR